MFLFVVDNEASSFWDRLAAGQWQGRIRDVTAMKSHKFRAFLKARRWNGNLYRRFVDDAEQDRSLPDAASWEQLEAYLKQCEADPKGSMLPGMSGNNTRKTASKRTEAP
jgi:hypothetical protein